MMRRTILLFSLLIFAFPLYSQGVSDIREDWGKHTLTEGLERTEKPVRDTIPIVGAVPASGRQVNTLSVEYVGRVIWPMGTQTGTALRDTAGTAAVSLISFDFYGTSQQVLIPAALKQVRLKGVSEKDVADFWMALSRINVALLLEDCENKRIESNFNDWALFDWLQHLAKAIYQGDQYAAASVFTVYMMNQLGMMTRVARADDKLYVLFSAVQTVYGRKFVVLDTYPFYLADPSFRANEIYTYNAGTGRRGRPFDLHMGVPVSIGDDSSYRTVRKASSVFHKTMLLPVNQSIMAFYSNYPQMDVTEYVPAHLEPRFEEALTRYISPLVEGKSILESVNLLFLFVQKDFEYKVDLEQFGYEKPYFPEENFVYAYNDCEDRSILFSFLVRNMLHEKVVLLDYNDHLAAAVRLPGAIRGDYLKIQNEKYYVCDPSFMNAAIGVSMPEYRNRPAKVWVME